MSKSVIVFLRVVRGGFRALPQQFAVWVEAVVTRARLAARAVMVKKCI